MRFRLAGSLDPALVERAFNEILRRHEVLRTTFTREHDEPAQVIRPSLQMRVPVTDLRHLAQPERDAELDRLSFSEARWQFDLAAGPLFRVGLLRVQDNEHVMLVTPHHSIVDYWSIGLISNELGVLYESYTQGTAPNLPELPIQYGDFAIWQREQCHGESMRQELDYWKRQLKDLPLLDFPTDHPRGESPTYDASITSILLPVTLTDAVRDLANREGATFFNTMLAALALVLNQYTGQDDFGVATQVAGRNSVEVEQLIGVFINNVVLRMDLSGDPAFPELIRRVQETGTQALAHQNVRFEQVLKELRPNHYPSHHTLFRLNFICQRDPVKPLEFAGIKLTVIPSKSQGALYDLNVFLVQRTEGWRLACEFNTDLYELPTITGLLSGYKTILENVVENPNRRVSEFPQTDGAKVARPAKPQAVSPATPPLSPGAAALESAMAVTEPLSIGPALDEPASSEVVMLPASPAQRRFWSLEEMTPGAPVLNMRACVRIRGEFSADIALKSLQLLVNRHEVLRTTFSQQQGELLQVIAPFQRIVLASTTLEHLAPAEREAKLGEGIRAEAGVAFDLARGPLMRARLFRLSAGDRVLMITTHHIVVDGWSQGVIQHDFWTLYDAIREDRSPVLSALPLQYGDFAHWQKEWLKSDAARAELEYWKAKLVAPLPALDFPADRVPANQMAVTGSMESLLLPQDLVQSLKDLTESQQVTMFVVMLTGFALLLYRHTGKEEMLIASPLANRGPETEAVVGPFAGPLLLRLNFKALTNTGEVLLHVRDVVLDALSHTEIPFEVLLDNIDVRSVHGRNPISQFYFFFQKAFLQPRQLRELTVEPLPDIGMGTHSELQMGILERAEGVRAQLEFNSALFLPATMRQLLADYRRLLECVAAEPDVPLADLRSPQARNPSRPAAAPELLPITVAANETERSLAEIWQRTLGLKTLGRKQNYFELGGNSLVAVRLFAEIEDRFKVRLPLSTLFEAQTIEQLARVLQQKAQLSAWSSIVQIQGTGSRPPFFCVHGAGGNVLNYRALAQHLGPDQPFYGLQCHGLDGSCALLTRIEEMAELYVHEIQSVQPRGPYHLGGYCMGGTVALEMAQRLVSKGEEVAFLALFDTLNWCKISRASAMTQGFYHLQRLLFHVRSFSLLDFAGKRNFLREKVASLRSRTQVWKGTMLRWITEHAADSESSLLARIWHTNDRACLKYVARPYPGTITDFRPLRQYSKYGGPETSWSGLAARHEILRMPVYPGGMLLEPFVQDLASAVRLCMDRAVAQREARDAGQPSAIPANAG